MEGKSIIGQIGVVFGTLLAIAVILYLAYAATKLLGKRFPLGEAAVKNQNIRQRFCRAGQNYLNRSDRRQNLSYRLGAGYKSYKRA